MTTRAARWSPALDAEPMPEIVDRRRAEVSLLSQVEAAQHALATGWGGPPVAIAVEMACQTPGAPAVGEVLYRVPLGVEHVHVTALATGAGSLRVTSVETDGDDIDAEGALLEWALPEVTPATLGIGDAVLVTAPGQAVRVSASATMTWQTVRLVLELDATEGEEHDHAALYGLLITPVHVGLVAS